MRAAAALATERVAPPGGAARNRVSTLRSQAPLMLRLTHPKGPEPWTAHDPSAARVCLTAGAAGPIGGDQLTLTVDVGAGSTLVLREVSASLLLPGPHGEQSALSTSVRVGAGATLVWLPEPVIAARGCDHRTDVSVELGPGARLVLREELLLGRHAEQPGAVTQQLHVRVEGRPLLNQHLAVGPGATGWDSAAVTGGRRALGSLVVVDPGWADRPPQPVLLGDTAAVLPLAGPAALVSAVAADALALRGCLDAGLALLTTPAEDRRPPDAS
ncbi:urease accessory protein UreD [Geodermatophilus sp. TF02-6]|uniref:urease accessory protein UreD n=1 Tax=Geodermatophilus sp. TF02-6 TaxID=2250575 RepID=UPI000E045632|nr:urease accessory protein UreD [Geodermatophilus sp. TF02-6]RBY75786.1 urease accessory protein UreD [Geodermatophilus sp. TF02-6]